MGGVVFATARSTLRLAVAWVRATARQIRRNIMVELAGALTFALLILLWTWMQGVDSYAVYVVGDLRQGSRHAHEVFEGVRERQWANRRRQPLLLGDIPVVFKEKNDFGFERGARRAAEELVAADDALMVVGHFASSRTKAVAETYLGAEPPIPMLLPTETNPHVIPPGGSDEYRPVYRLSPTDDQQAALAARYLVQRGCERIVALDDRSLSPTDNNIYSRYLVDEFVKQVLLRTPPGAPSVRRVWPQDVRRLRLDADESVPGDCVFFVGGWSTALLVIERMHPQASRYPAVVLSDSAVDPRLLGRLPLDAPTEVVIAHTVSSSESNALRTLGHDVFDVVEGLIDESQETFGRGLKRHGLIKYWLHVFGIHRVKAARLVLASNMERAVARRKVFSERNPGRSFTFRYDGSRDDARFFLWRLRRDGDLEDIEPNGPSCPSEDPGGSQPGSPQRAASPVPHRGSSTAAVTTLVSATLSAAGGAR